jgi:excinuclease UvrABC helicase subunit UvrB
MPENALAALTQVAAVGAMTLVTTMTTNVWRKVWERVTELLSRGDSRRKAPQRQLTLVLDHKLAEDLTARLDSLGHPAHAADDLATALLAQLLAADSGTEVQP